MEKQPAAPSPNIQYVTLPPDPDPHSWPVPPETVYGGVIGDRRRLVESLPEIAEHLRRGGTFSLEGPVERRIKSAPGERC